MDESNLDLPTMYLGIDPGRAGGLAVICEGTARAWKMPDTERDIFDLLESIRRDGDIDYPNILALIEKVHAIPVTMRDRATGVERMGVPTSAFKFGMGYGFLRGCLTGLHVPFDEAPPQTWQKALGCMTGGDKNISKTKAQQLYPALKITHATADALLIATYLMHLKLGILRRKENIDAG